MYFFDIRKADFIQQQRQEDFFVGDCAKFLNQTYNIYLDAAYAIAHCLFARMNDFRLHYHTPIHILSIFDFAREHKISLQHHETLAIWFHDAIYEPTNKNNEERSTDFMIALVSEYIPYEKYSAAANIIEDTARHLEPLQYNSSDLVLDLDISNFACDCVEHLTANEAIRREFSQYSDLEFLKGRLDFLQKFLAKGFIYRTPIFKEKFETKAITNIQEDIEEINRTLGRIS